MCGRCNHFQKSDLKKLANLIVNDRVVTLQIKQANVSASWRIKEEVVR